MVYFEKSIEGAQEIELNADNYFKIVTKLNLPIFKNRKGERPSLPLNLANKYFKTPEVFVLNITADIYAYCKKERTLSEYMNYLKQSSTDKLKYDDIQDFVEDAQSIPEEAFDYSQWINVGEYSSQVAVAPRWNLQFLTSDFWKHGQAGLIDITEPIFPTTWYGRRHPFEFECIVVNDPGIHKVFQNLEIVANKAQPESFHFEIIGETYDFHKDKPNMYFRQEARKALLQYNGCDVLYNRNF